MIETEGKTLDEVVQEVMAKLVVQGKRCTKTDGTWTHCVYGDGEGNHCAVGWLLPEDNEDIMDFDGVVDDLLTSFNEFPNRIFMSEHIGVLEVLQNLHDAVTFQSREHNLKELVGEYGITPSALLQRWVDMGTTEDNLQEVY